MAETEPAATTTTSALPQADNAVATPAPAPVAESAPNPTATESPVPIAKEVSTAPESKPVEPSLLSVEPAKESSPDVKDGEKKPETTEAPKPEINPESDVKPEPKSENDAKPEEASLPSYEPFKLPEGFKADESALGEFSSLLGQLEIAKGDHVKTSEIGQKMVDLFAAKMAEGMKMQTEYFTTLHTQDKQKQLDELKSDSYFGANGDESARTKIQLEFGNFLQRNIPKEDLKAFKEMVDSRGIENNLPLARVLNTLKQKIERYEREPDASKVMLAAEKPQPTQKFTPGKNVMQTLYGKK